MHLQGDGSRSGPSEWRAAVARRVAPVYAVNPRVAAVLLGGSTARGLADRFSDIELGVFWREPPTEEERAEAIAQAGGDLHRLYPYDPVDEVWPDSFAMGRAQSGEPLTGVPVDMGHYTLEYTERVLGDVLDRYDTTDFKQSLISAILHGIPLHGEGLIESWRAKARDYPQGVALAMVRQHSQIEFFWRTEMYLERGNNRLMVNSAFVQAGKQLFYVLLALNGIYFSGFKWLEWQLTQMQIAPPDFAARLQSVFASEPLEAKRRLSELVDETYDLIEQQMPEIDVVRLRWLFHYNRPQWEEAPPGGSL